MATPPAPGSPEAQVIDAATVLLNATGTVMVSAPGGIATPASASQAGKADAVTQLMIDIQADPEMMAGAPGLAKIIEKYQSGLANAIPSVAEIPDFQAEVWDEANKKGDSLFAQQQDLIKSIGETAPAYKAVHEANRKMYEQNILINGVIKGGTDAQKISFRHYYKSVEEMQKLYAGIINDDLLITHFAPKTTAQLEAELPILGKALGYRTSMVQSFMKRQFALTGEADDDLLRSTLAHTLAIEKSTGISSKIIAKGVGVMIEEVNLFGNMVPETMARASAAVAKLGLEMSSFTGIVKTFGDFESAAAASAKVSQALGVQLDVMDMVAMAAEGQDELIPYIKQQFDIAGADVSQMGLPLKRVIMKALGLGDIEEVEQMFGAASSGLDQFLADTDSGLATVGDSQVESALADSQKNLAELRILQGDVKSQTDAMTKLLKDALSDGLTVAAEDTKQQMEGIAFDLIDLEGELIKKGLLDPILKMTKMVNERVIQEFAGGIHEARERVRKGATWEDVMEDVRGKITKTPKQKEESVAARAQRTRLDAITLDNPDIESSSIPRTPFEYKTDTGYQISQLQEYIADNTKPTTAAEKKLLTDLLQEMIKRQRNKDKTDDVIEIKITSDGKDLIFTPKGGTPVTLPASTS